MSGGISARSAIRLTNSNQSRIVPYSQPYSETIVTDILCGGKAVTDTLSVTALDKLRCSLFIFCVERRD